MVVVVEEGRCGGGRRSQGRVGEAHITGRRRLCDDWQSAGGTTPRDAKSVRYAAVTTWGNAAGCRTGIAKAKGPSRPSQRLIGYDDEGVVAAVCRAGGGSDRGGWRWRGWGGYAEQQGGR